MAIPAERLLALLDLGCYITTFYRLPAKTAFHSTTRVPEGYILMSKTEEEAILAPPRISIH